jgi:CubicO group peptidase (beta-lactamase class C family)
MHRIPFLIAGLLALPALLAPPARAGDPLDGFDGYVERAMADWETPGLSIAVVQNGQVTMAKGYGFRTKGGGAQVDAGTVFAAGSISKTFTASAVAALIARDRMRWDDRVIDHLPGFRLHDPYVTREIRMRDLLSQRSGLPRGELLWFYAPFDRREILRRLQYLESENGFRSGFSYNNLMFVAAGEAVAAAAGMSWDNFLADTFFGPLGMSSTTTSVVALGGNAATPHARVDGVIQPIAWLNVDNIAPAGGVNSSAADLAKWMLFQLADGSTPRETVLRPADAEEMRTPQTVIRVTDSRRADIPETLFRAYGLGWFLEDYRGVQLAYHGGRIDGMSSRLTVVPERGLGIAILTNRGRSNLPDALTYRLLDAYLGAPPRDWSAAMLRRGTDPYEKIEDDRKGLLAQRIPDTNPTLPLARYAGLYDSRVYGPLDVVFNGEALVLTRGADVVARLSHFHYDTFFADFANPALRDQLVRFEIDNLGRVASLELENDGRFQATAPPLPNDLAPVARTDGATGKLLGLWTCRWNGIQPHSLFVERIDGDKATVIYAWGRAPSWGVEDGGWRRLEGRIADGVFSAEAPDGGTVSYVLQPGGALLAQMQDGARRRQCALRPAR